MNNIIKLVVAISVAGVLMSGAGCGASGTGANSTMQDKAAAVDVGNKICPVMGEEVSGKDFYVYKGKRYGLCCPMCPATFAGNPEKYSAIADKEVAEKK